MFMFRIFLPATALCLISSVCEAQHPNLGRPLTPEEISKLDITVAPDGVGLPAGSGSVSAGASVYALHERARNRSPVSLAWGWPRADRAALAGRHESLFLLLRPVGTPA